MYSKPKNDANVASHSIATVWQPAQFDLTKPEEYEIFFELYNQPQVSVHNSIYSQVKDLIKCENPKKQWDKYELETAVKNRIGANNEIKFGRWFYYPWSRRLVHLLNEHDFIKVRTNRNFYKITPEEFGVLSKKKIGVIGLSVGQSVSLTMAMERIFGELRIADFDELELTNLNRIRSGVHNLGLNKAVLVAREIMEIDPYLKLSVFDQGLTEENMESFLTADGNLDLLVDECDGLDIKVLCRIAAKKHKIPVLMEASDRCMVDVERFDLEPERDLLHGLIKDLSVPKLKNLKTNEDKVPYMLAIVGTDTLSTRAQASMLEIGQSINTWPQLASAVTMGGGICADVARRILLNDFTDSGRFYVDIEKIIGNKVATSTLPEVNQANLSVEESWQNWVKQNHISHSKATLPKNDIEEIIQAACHAPSGGNLQPWYWIVKDNVLYLFILKSQSSTFLDKDYCASMVALGASSENAILKAQQLGYSANLIREKGHDNLVASITLIPAETIDSIDRTLAEAIYLRETNRNLELLKPIAPEFLEAVSKSLGNNGSELIFYSDEQKVSLSEQIAQIERIRLMNETGHRDFVAEMRWTKAEAVQTRDGIDLDTCDLTESEKAGLALARFPEVIELLTDWQGGLAFEKLSKKSTSAAPILGAICRKNNTPDDYFSGGRDLERAWIMANKLGLGFQPQSPLTFVLKRLFDKDKITKKETNELIQISKNIQLIFGTERFPIFLFRIFYPEKPVTKSLRHPHAAHYQILQ
jgi:molybdopterin/thiamine biosynthesis adenylyltransferase